MGMASANDAEGSVGPPLARTCRRASADVKTHRDGAGWTCHTCGRKLSEWTSGLLTGVAWSRHRSPGARDATHLQLPLS